MVQTAASTIALTPPARTIERIASEGISPGHIVELLSTNKFQKNDTIARAGTPKLIALEKEYAGKEIDVAYITDDQVIVGVFRAGDEVVLKLPASAAAVVIGDELEPFTGGVVRKAAGALDLSAVGTANTTLENVGATNGGDVSGAIENNFADVGAQINASGTFAIALEAVDNSGGGSEVFIRALLV